MKLFRIKDNNSRKKEEFDSDIPKITKKVADVTLGKLEKQGVFIFPSEVRHTEDLEGKQKILKSVDDDYCAGNVMGFIGCEEERLIIESRFAEDDDYFLTYLLSKVLDIPNIVDLQATDYNQDSRLFEYLLFFFPIVLKSAMRKGVYKTYIRKHYNDANIKGTIDVARHISRNTPFQGKIAYSQREYAYDNELLELIRHTIEFIRQKPYGKRILEKAKDEVKTVVEVTQSYNIRDRKKMIDNNRKNIIRHAYYHEYRELQRLCILILQHEKHQIGMDSRQSYGILFDGSWLWEEYVNTLISDLFYHPMNKKHKGKQYLFEGDGGPEGEIYPDFISRENDPRMIADAKYKFQENIGKKNKDYFQVLAYMLRFDAKKGYFLYPERGGKESEVLWLNKGLAYEGNVSPREDMYLKKVGLKIPSGMKSYDDFSEEMQKSEEAFRKEICGAADNKAVLEERSR